MEMAFIGIYGGSETLVVRGMTKEALEKFVEVNDYRRHPRLQELTITQPEVEAAAELARNPPPPPPPVEAKLHRKDRFDRYNFDKYDCSDCDSMGRRI